MRWPEGKRFAFTIFDDPDSQTLEQSRRVYGFLRDLGLRTTKGVWPLAADPALASDPGLTCTDPEYLSHVLQLRDQGFEIGFHNATSHTSNRPETIAGLDRFRELFGHDPVTMSNHYHCRESVYWGPERLGGARRLVYDALTRGRNRGQSFGHVAGDARFWGDLCQSRVRYVRNFVFGGLNTLAACPWMPYRDSKRPLVNAWYASSEGANVHSAVKRLNESAQDRLEEQGGACILYVHFGHGFAPGAALDRRFQSLMERLARKSGWFVPAGTLLDYLRFRQQQESISDADRTALEWRWLWHKVRFGSA